jgi:Arc/MetJ-type ribon-helix-helix transcriptional regulator
MGSGMERVKTISVDLPERTAEEIDRYVRAGWFASAAEAIRMAVLEFVRHTRSELREGEDGAPSDTGAAPPIEDVLAQIASQVPEQEWRKLPADLNENLDHYLYGAPKK